MFMFYSQNTNYNVTLNLSVIMYNPQLTDTINFLLNYLLDKRYDYIYRTIVITIFT